MSLQKTGRSNDSAMAMRELKVTDEPINLNELPEEVLAVHEGLYALIHECPELAIDELKDYLEKYPDHPILLNWLVSAYRINDQEDESIPSILRNYQKNPTYLFARINYALYELQKNSNHKIIPEIFDNIVWLPDLYPEREEFHKTEAESFYCLMGYYYMYDEQFDKAQNMVDIIKSFHDKEEGCLNM